MEEREETVKILVAPAIAVKDKSNARIIVDRISFDGIERTKYDGLVKEIRHLFSVDTLGDLIRQTYQTQRHMMYVGLFERIGVVISESNSEKPHDVGAQPVEVTFVVKEPQRIKANVNVGVTNRGEAQTGCEAMMKSSFGRAETINIGIQYGHQKTAHWQASFHKPLLGRRGTVLGWHVSRLLAEMPWSSFAQQDHNLMFDIRHNPNAFDFFQHTFRWEGSWRKIGALSDATPFYVRQQAGNSLKSSIHNIFQYSTLDSTILPTKGFLVRVAQEFAGLGGDVNFLRHDVTFQSAVTLPWDFVLATSANSSLVRPVGQAQQLLLPDRLYLGGANSVRGFEYAGIGPRIGSAFVGGMCSWTAGLHLYRRLFLGDFLHAQCFVNAGNIYPVDGIANLGKVVRSLAEQSRVSVGIGLVLKFADRFRAELNYSVPFSEHPNDAKQPGFHIGFAIG